MNHFHPRSVHPVLQNPRPGVDSMEKEMGDLVAGALGWLGSPSLGGVGAQFQVPRISVEVGTDSTLGMSTCDKVQDVAPISAGS